MRPEDLRALLDERVLLLDGGMGTLLMAAGLERGRAPEWWNLDHPDRVEVADRGYADAGSDIVHANTFGATPPKLAAAGLAGRCREVNAAAVAICRSACASRALVAGDVGPTGLLLAPVGQASVDEIREAYREQAEALAATGADLISIETQYDLREALAAVEASVATGLAVIASMTFESRKRGFFTIMGDPLVPALLALAEAGAVAVGCNCSVTSPVMLGMIREARGAVSAPLTAQPNAGQPRMTPQGPAYDAAPEQFAADASPASDVYGLGATMLFVATGSSGFSIAFKAEPRITGIVSPGNSYLVRRSRTSSSTSSRSSSSSTMSTLLRYTTILGTPTCRARRMCSRVCGMGPSAALTTRTAPSIWAAPVIMFFT